MPRCGEVSLWPDSTLALRVLASFEARPVRCSAGPALQKQESSSLASIHGKSAPKRGRRSRWAAARRWPTCAPGQRRGRRGGRGERAGNRPHPALEAAGGRAVVPARQGEKLSNEEMRTLLVIRAGEHDPASRSVPRLGASTCCRKGRRRVRGPANAFHVLKPRKADSGPAAPEVRRGPGLRGPAPGPCCPLASTGSRVPGSPRRGWGGPGSPPHPPPLLLTLLRAVGGARAGWGRHVPTPTTRPPAGPAARFPQRPESPHESLACGVAAPEGARRGLSNLFLEGGPPRTGDTAKSPGTPRPVPRFPPTQARPMPRGQGAGCTRP